MTRATRARLPDDAIDRAAEMVRRSQPSGRAPIPASLPPEAVVSLSSARSRRAVIYSSMEDMIDRTHAIAEELETQGVVIDIMNDADAESLVNHMVSTASTLADGSSDDFGADDDTPLEFMIDVRPRRK